MTPDQLITFAIVAEHRNISRAALALHLSQPAVSGQLRQLQDEFGEPLYQRDGRGIRLTAAGEQLAAYAARLAEIFAQAEALRDALRGFERGTLRIGASTTPASYLLPYLIAGFHRRYPDVTIQTIDGNTSDIVAALGTLDIAMIEGPVGADLPPGTGVTPWREDEIVAIVPCAHALAQWVKTGAGNDADVGPGRDADSRANTSAGAAPRSATLAEIAAYPLVLREAGSGVRQIVERAFARAAAPMRVALEIAGVEGVKEAVRAGMGIGFVSAMSMRHEDGALIRLPIAPEPLARRFSILMPHAATPSRVAARFHELCLEDTGDTREAG